MMVGKMKVKRPGINEGERSYTILSLTALDSAGLESAPSAAGSRRCQRNDDLSYASLRKAERRHQASVASEKRGEGGREGDGERMEGG